MDAELGIVSFENELGDGERYLSSVFAPEFGYGLWSGGLRLMYRWNRDDGRRDEDYDSFSDYLAVIRFVQFSEKYEEGWYGRLGDIDHAQLGYGQFVNRYRNTLSLDDPETGLILDSNEEDYLVEGLFSDLAEFRVYGVRGAYQPFKADSTHRFHRMSFGATLAGDLSEEARLVNRFENGLPFFEEDAPIGADTIGLGAAEKVSPLTMIGIDAGMPVSTDRVDELTVFGEIGSILGFGVGLGVGLEMDHRFDDRWRVRAWVEQQLLGQEYVPSYFNSRYERDRIRTTTVTLADSSEVDAIQTKRNQLYARDEVDLGSYVSMEYRYRNDYRLRWSLQHSWTREESGWFELDFRIRDPNLPFEIRYVFDRVNMNGIGDILGGDSADALHRVEFAYQVGDYILLGFRYRQSFEQVERLGRRVGTDKSSRIEPAVIIRIQ
ncbi:MAG: hypothetical protein HKN17_07450 [Rhodothermales bacterium]|nr:hypothetical protein [Rhodothermales bacterium]